MTRMRTYRSLIAVAGLAAVMALAGAASAQQFMNINFNADSIGSAPSTGPAGTPIITLGAIGGYDTDPLPVGDPGYKSPPTASCGTTLVDNVAGMINAVVLNTASTNGEVGALWLDTGYSIVSNNLTLSFDLNVISAATNSGQTYTLSTDSTVVHPFFGVNTFSSGTTLRFNAVATSASGGIYGLRVGSFPTFQIVPFFTYANGVAHTVSLDADYAAGTVTALVDGTPQLTDYAFAAPSGGTTTLAESFFYLNGNVGDSNSIGIDNISGIVPEPGTALTLFGLVGLLGLRRARRQA